MFNAGIQACKFGLVVQQLVAKFDHHCIQRRFDSHDVDQIAVPIQSLAMDADFRNIVMGVGLVFATPIAADQKMIGD